MIIRQVLSKNLLRVNYHVGKTAGRFFSKDSGDSSSSDSDDEAKKPSVSNDRLNELLASMKVSGKSFEVTPKSLRQRQETKKPPIEEAPTLERVTKNVAESLGGDARQTESELLRKLLDISNQASEAKIKTEGAEDGSKLNDIIVGMKIERTKKSPESTVSEQFVRRSGKKTERVIKERVAPVKPVDVKHDRINLWSAQPLNIFTKDVKESADPLEIWTLLQNRELQATFDTPPRNYFEKMQRWTTEGKVWRFPIDNEQGLEEEAKVYFADHVFLEPHLEPWCPKTGPVRHFMELVCVGLSKNPYITIQEKQAHIAWFQQYFEGKKELLKEIIIQEGKEKQAIERKAE
ncbi:small ribosomal subunit protein mS31 [Phlebotomus argentipes]|uniref:small ribosomal subunit protein mS31 n=1 Tax=Phlebotomus argentipes TaxID=94469 RepID=UPI0028936EC8|nr:small ribosomal subunit protein mS31 [Phlebotomus argentipes]